MKTIKKIPAHSHISMLTWATSNGSKVLSFDKNLGDFTRGKKPGIVLIENIRGEILPKQVPAGEYLSSTGVW